MKSATRHITNNSDAHHGQFGQQNKDERGEVDSKHPWVVVCIMR